MEGTIVQAVQTFRAMAEHDDRAIVNELIKLGIAPPLAERSVEFIPIAYGRAILERAGGVFPETFQRCGKDGTPSPATLLASEPVWLSAYAFARREMNNGVALEEMLRIGGRSAEFQVANQLLADGSELQDLRFTPPLLMWPDPDHQTTRITLWTKKWWQFWR